VADLAAREQEPNGKNGTTSPTLCVLTPQERRVLQLITEGRTTKEIAGELAVSVNTVHTHRNNLMAKLDIHKETDLVRHAIREGIARV